VLPTCRNLPPLPWLAVAARIEHVASAFHPELFLGVGETALAPLYQSAKKKMRHFEPFRIRWGTTQQANISWTESD